MSETTAMTTTQAISEFRKAFESGLNSIVTAANIYVASIDENPRNADQFKLAFADSIPASAWSGFEAVGRKWMHPKLIMGGMANSKKSSVIKRLPYSLQERVFEHERFDLLCANGDTLQIDVTEATPEQAEQIFDGSAIRSLSAQKCLIEARREKAQIVPEPDTLPYTIRDGKVTFRRGVTMTRQEIKRLLEAM